MSKRLGSAIMLVTFSLAPLTAFGQRTEQASPASAAPVPAVDNIIEAAPADKLLVRSMLNLTPVTNAVTPAEDISAGVFGGNTGGGNYGFPAGLGVGVASPGSRLHVDISNGTTYTGVSPTSLNMNVLYRNTADGANVYAGFMFAVSGNGQNRISYMGAISESAANRRMAFVIGTDNGTTRAERLRITSDGNVGVGTGSPTAKLHVVGNATFTGTVTGGTISAHYQDLAEWVPTTHSLEAGEVVVLDPSAANHVMRSTSAYDSRVAGVVSAQPGIILGESGESKEAIATTGRVKVRVEATTAPIRIGDLLVTSSKPGVAMRSEPLIVNGRQLHQPGTIIGKALEPLESGSAEILVLLSLQ